MQRDTNFACEAALKHDLDRLQVHRGGKVQYHELCLTLNRIIADVEVK
jgi:hypothetical protein